MPILADIRDLWAYADKHFIFCTLPEPIAMAIAGFEILNLNPINGKYLPTNFECEECATTLQNVKWNQPQCK